MTNIKIKKERIKKIIENDFNENSTLIYLLVTSGRLDNVIEKLDEEKTVTNSTCIIKKGYLTSEEQFVEVLSHIIWRINIDFWFLKRHKNLIIESILTCEQTLSLLLSKKYLGNNKYINYYNLTVKKVCIINFFRILKYINMTDTINRFLLDNHINLKTFNLNNIKNVDKLYQCLRLICICNPNAYGLLYIFDSNINKNNKEMYCIQIELLIEKTYKLQSAVSILLQN